MRIENQNVFFTSDFHVGHANVIKHDNRPFKDINEMNDSYYLCNVEHVFLLAETFYFF